MYKRCTVGHTSQRTGNPRAPPEILNDIVVNTCENKLVLLLELHTRGLRVVGTDGGGLVERRESGGSVGDGGVGSLCECGELRNDGDVGELAVVSGTHGVEADEVERVGVAVVSADLRDDGCGEVRVDHGEVVGAHLSETVGVFVDEGASEERVDLVLSAELERACGEITHLRRTGGVGGELVGEGGVLEGEEEDLDRVGEAEVDGDGRLGSRGDRDIVGHLRLFDEDVAGGTGHALTFVVGDDRVVGPDLDGLEGRFDGVKEVGGNGIGAVGRIGRSERDVALCNEELTPVAEGEVDAHFVVRESRGR